MKLWHCNSARSLRPLWALEEMNMEYELEILPFPPRFMQPDFLQINRLGTVPYFIDGNVRMTESTAICQYLVDRYQRFDLSLCCDHNDYGNYINWLYHADATLTFPQTLVLRYYYLEPNPEKRQVADDYRRWFIARLKLLDSHLENHEYLVDDRFTIADIAVSYALYLGRVLQLHIDYQPQTRDYLERLMQRAAFKRANAMGEPLDLSTLTP